MRRTTTATSGGGDAAPVGSPVGTDGRPENTPARVQHGSRSIVSANHHAGRRKVLTGACRTHDISATPGDPRVIGHVPYIEFYSNYDR